MLVDLESFLRSKPVKKRAMDDGIDSTVLGPYGGMPRHGA